MHEFCNLIKWSSGHADINCKDSRGQTPLMIAARRGHMVVAKCLLSHGADPIACDYEALEPLEYCKRGDYRMKKLINRFASKSNKEMLRIEFDLNQMTACLVFSCCLSASEFEPNKT